MESVSAFSDETITTGNLNKQSEASFGLSLAMHTFVGTKLCDRVCFFTLYF
jgi:hypothetical protein